MSEQPPEWSMVYDFKRTIDTLREENEALRNLCLNVPSLIDNAEADGRTEFSAMIYGYEIVYQHYNAGTEDSEWIAFISDTAD